MGKKIDDRFHFSCLVGMLIFVLHLQKSPGGFFSLNSHPLNFVKALLEHALEALDIVKVGERSNLFRMGKHKFFAAMF